MAKMLVNNSAKEWYEIIHLAKYAAVIARAQARGNLRSSRNRLLRHFIPRNDPALTLTYLARHSSEMVLRGRS